MLAGLLFGLPVVSVAQELGDPPYTVTPSDVRVPDGVEMGQFQRTFRPFGDGTLICDDYLSEGRTICNARQVLSDRNGALAFSWALAVTSEGVPYMLLRTAPHADNAGFISIKFEGRAQPVDVYFDGCNEAVCVAMLPVDPIMRSEIANESSASEKCPPAKERTRQVRCQWIEGISRACGLSVGGISRPPANAGNRLRCVCAHQRECGRDAAVLGHFSSRARATFRRPCSGEHCRQPAARRRKAREIWLVDKAPVVIQKLETAVHKLDIFMKSQGLDYAPDAVPNLKGDAARAAFIEHFKEVQRLKTQLDQYTDLTPENAATIEQILPRDNLLGFRGAYLETAQRLRAKQGKGADKPTSEADQLDFEFVLFASTVIDYDYIMGLIARYSEATPGKQKMSREELIGLIQSDAKFMDEREDIAAYINTLNAGEGLSEKAIRDGYNRFKAEKNAAELAGIAGKHELATEALQGFVDTILQRMIFDGEALTDLMEPLGLNWKARRVKELGLMADLMPLLLKRAAGREISGLSAYEQ